MLGLGCCTATFLRGRLESEECIYGLCTEKGTGRGAAPKLISTALLLAQRSV